MHFYQKYSVLDFKRIQKPLTWNTKPRRAPLSNFGHYFRHYVSKGSPLIFCKWMDVEKAQSAPFTFFGTMRLFKILIFRFFFENFCRRVPPSIFFDILQQTGFSKSQKGPPFTILKTALFEPWI